MSELLKYERSKWNRKVFLDIRYGWRRFIRRIARRRPIVLRKPRTGADQRDCSVAFVPRRVEEQDLLLQSLRDIDRNFTNLDKRKGGYRTLIFNGSH